MFNKARNAKWVNATVSPDIVWGMLPKIKRMRSCEIDITIAIFTTTLPTVEKFATISPFVS
jgi:hypothetical protein